MNKSTKITIGAIGALIGAAGTAAYVYLKKNPEKLDEILSAIDDLKDGVCVEPVGPISFSYSELSKEDLEP